MDTKQLSYIYLLKTGIVVKNRPISTITNLAHGSCAVFIAYGKLSVK